MLRGVPDEQPAAASGPGGDRPDLRADCERCFGLCCVASAFSASADFAITKAAGQPCPNLRPDFRCGIHARLRPRGFPGCAAYDCFGAGQQVAQVTFGGRDWRAAPDHGAQMFRVFAIMRQLHELLWYLGEARALPPASSLRGELSRAIEETERLTRASPGALEELDLAAYRQGVAGLLRRAGDLARAAAMAREASPAGPDLAGPDLAGRDLAGKKLRDGDLRGASLRGASLIGADLRGADLAAADLTGADLRGADLSGADLSRTLFLIQSQLEAAAGDAATRLPSSLTRPSHWPGGISRPQARPSRRAATSRPAGPSC